MTENSRNPFDVPGFGVSGQELLNEMQKVMDTQGWQYVLRADREVGLRPWPMPGTPLDLIEPEFIQVFMEAKFRLTGVPL